MTSRYYLDSNTTAIFPLSLVPLYSSLLTLATSPEPHPGAETTRSHGFQTHVCESHFGVLSGLAKKKDENPAAVAAVVHALLENGFITSAVSYSIAVSSSASFADTPKPLFYLAPALVRLLSPEELKAVCAHTELIPTLQRLSPDSGLLKRLKEIVA